MCHKATFKTSPNRMSTDEVEQHLVEAQKIRLNNKLLEDWKEVLNKWSKRKFLLFK